MVMVTTKSGCDLSQKSIEGSDIDVDDPSKMQNRRDEANVGVDSFSRARQALFKWLTVLIGEDRDRPGEEWSRIG